MDRAWASEIAVDAGLASALIEEQFPDLAPLVVEALRPGWDNSVFRVNGRFAFRFPRREIAVPLIETELGCLSFINAGLPVPIPVPVFSGRPSAAYPWPFGGFIYLAGTRATRGNLDTRWRERLAVTLAEFLKALHAIAPADLPADALPFDRLDRLNARKRRALTASRLDHLVSAGVIADGRPILAIIDEAPQPVRPARLTVTHGDLHAGQLLLAENDELAGVIDWGDVHLGDPAVDLAAAFQLLPRRLHDTFYEIYGPVDRTSRELANARAAWHAVAMLASAMDAGDRELADEAKTAIAFITKE